MTRFIRRYEKRPIPLVLYSNRPVGELAQTAETLGAAGYVQKGQPDGALLTTINSVLGSQRAQVR